LSWKYANKLETQIKAEVAELLRQAEEADNSEAPDGLDLPAELARREERLTAIARAKAEIERRAAKRHAREQAEYEHKLDQRKTRCPQPAPAKAFARSRTLARGCRCPDADDAPLADNSRPNALRQEKMYGRTGVRHHQGDHGVLPVPVARGGIGPRGMESETVTCPEGMGTLEGGPEDRNPPKISLLSVFLTQKCRPRER